MPEPKNNRWKLEPQTAITIATILLTAGMIWGSLSARLGAIEAKVESIEKKMVTRDEIVILKAEADREHDKLWQIVRPALAANKKGE